MYASLAGARFSWVLPVHVGGRGLQSPSWRCAVARGSWLQAAACMVLKSYLQATTTFYYKPQITLCYSQCVGGSQQSTYKSWLVIECSACMLASLCMFSFFLITPLCNMMFVGQLSLMTGRSVAKCRVKENEVINSQASHSIFELIGSCSCNHLKCLFLHKTRQHSLFYFSSRNKEAWVVGDLVTALWWKCLVGNGEPLHLH